MQALARVGSKQHSLIGSSLARFYQHVDHASVADSALVIKSLGKLGFKVVNEQASKLMGRVFGQKGPLETRPQLLRHAVTINA